MGAGRDAYNVLCGSMKEREYSKVLGFDGRIILKCILQKSYGRRGMD
jgi:hypothetical protein